MKKQLKFLAIVASTVLSQSFAVSALRDVNDGVDVTTPLTLQDRHAYRVGAGSGNTMASVVMNDKIRAIYGGSGGAVTGGSTITLLTAHGGGELTLTGGEYPLIITDLTKDAPGKLVFVIDQALGVEFTNVPTFSNGASYADITFRMTTGGGTLTLPPAWGGDSIIDAKAGSVSELEGITSMPILKGEKGSKLTLPAAITTGTQKKIAGMKGRLVTGGPLTLD